MAASLAVSFLMLAGKMTAYFITGSAAILSDAVESVIHLFATGFAAFSLWYAVRPPDAGHPYGHGKIAYFSSGFEGGLILIAAVTILYSAVRALIEGPALRQLDVGLWILAGLTLVNLGLGLALVYVGRRHRSLVLEANGRHVLTDMWTSLGVLAGVGLVALTGRTWLDPLVAVAVAVNILWTGVRLVRQAVSGLMEAADAGDTQKILSVLDRAVADGLISGYHQVRHRRVNDQRWIEYHLLFPETLSITEAHDRSHVVEAAIAREFEGAEVFVTAHLEPEAHAAAHPEDHTEPADPLRAHLADPGT
ncbi:cation diffusion facilitator family transporter [Rhodocaloribacter litoris]|uniref:cation diffusion facilitator family transporter n=1 Tax=Rhodocaloribacter litoris TaxID=2558931 RepID=UPI001422571A|nr:cation diffusion facilitator family transporter [Rhodocaloribacter litoris]QXD16122.1 cation diffusion facilitator family transporter [Rhodocaloribacter litoris]